MSGMCNLTVNNQQLTINNVYIQFSMSNARHFELFYGVKRNKIGLRSKRFTYN